MKIRHLLTPLCATLLLTAAARADDKASCLDASSKGQTLRDQHKLLDARQQFRLCAAAACPSVVQTDCASWLADVDKAVPAVVLSAKNGAGADVFDAKVTLDGQPLASRLDGRAIDVDPGRHTFHFELADGTHADLEVLVREGEKSQAVTAQLGVVPSASAAATATPAGATAQTASRPLRTVGWVLGGLGAAGLVVGTAFGVVAISDKSSAGCVDNLCNPGTTSGIKNAALVSDVGWIGGGLLLAGGAALVLLSPSAQSPTTALRVSPFVGPAGGGASLGGSF
jgi:hypothetical protein